VVNRKYLEKNEIKILFRTMKVNIRRKYRKSNSHLSETGIRNRGKWNKKCFLRSLAKL
jgi:hypothetical protein